MVVVVVVVVWMCIFDHAGLGPLLQDMCFRLLISNGFQTSLICVPLLQILAHPTTTCMIIYVQLFFKCAQRTHGCLK